MNASLNDTTAALAAKWAAVLDDGNAPSLTLAEVDHLIALTPANDARALAELAEYRAIEVELLGYDPADIVDIDACDIDDDCVACSGTGIGRYDGPCSMCGGTGEAHDAPLWDDPLDLDDDAMDAYLVGAYESAVA